MEAELNRENLSSQRDLRCIAFHFRLFATRTTSRENKREIRLCPRASDVS